MTRIKATDLADLSGYTIRRLQQIAAAGYYPRSKRGVYDYEPTMRGLFKYLRELASTEPDSYREERRLYMRARRQKMELERDEYRKKFWLRTEVLNDVATVARVTNAKMYAVFCNEVPNKILGLTDFHDIAEVMRRACDNVNEHLRSKEAWYKNETKENNDSAGNPEGNGEDPGPNHQGTETDG